MYCNSKGTEHPLSVAMVPTQSPVQCVPLLFPGNEASGWPPTPPNVEVKERIEIYPYSHSEPSWSVPGWTLPLPYFLSIFLSCKQFHMYGFSGYEKLFLVFVYERKVLLDCIVKQEHNFNCRLATNWNDKSKKLYLWKLCAEKCVPIINLLCLISAWFIVCLHIQNASKNCTKTSTFVGSRVQNLLKSVLWILYYRSLPYCMRLTIH